MNKRSIFDSRLMRNKRGDDMIVDFVAILVFAVIMVIFIVLFSVEHSRIDNTIKTQFESKDADFMLESFLRSPAVGVDSSKSISEIIAEDCGNGEFTRSEDLFNRYFILSDSTSSIVVNIEGENDYTLKYTGEDKNTFLDRIGYFTMTQIWISKNNFKSETYIPGLSGSKIHVTITETTEEKNA